MKTLIVYYSRTGFTEKIALQIAKLLKADVEKILDKGVNRKGVIGYLRSGKESTQGIVPEIQTPKKKPKLYDLVIVGTPVWAFTLASPVLAYLTKYSKELKKVAFFATLGGSGEKRTFAEMERLACKKPIASLAVKTKEVANSSQAVNDFVAKLK